MIVHSREPREYVLQSWYLPKPPARIDALDDRGEHNRIAAPQDERRNHTPSRLSGPLSPDSG